MHTFSFTAVNNGIEWAVLIGKTPGYPMDYTTWTRTSEIPDKYLYKIVMPGNNFETITVSVPGSTDALAMITDEQISAGCATLRPVLVRFTNAVVKFYVGKDKKEKLTGEANGIEVVKPTSK